MDVRRIMETGTQQSTEYRNRIERVLWRKSIQEPSFEE